MNEQIRADCFKRGELFGEIALFYSCKRTATVKSEDSVVLWGRTGGLTNTHTHSQLLLLLSILVYSLLLRWLTLFVSKLFVF